MSASKVKVQKRKVLKEVILFHEDFENLLKHLCRAGQLLEKISRSQYQLLENFYNCLIIFMSC